MATFTAFACEPCSKILTLEETVEKAQFIIIGQKIGEADKPSKESIDGPPWIEVKINSILKGDIDTNKIKAASWYGMCRYGFANVGYDRLYVMFLERAEGGTLYDAVDWGCSVKKLWVENNTVTYNGEKVSIDEFAERFNLEQPTTIKQQVDDTTTVQPEDQTIPFVYIILIVGVFLLLVVIWLKIKKVF